MLCFRWAQGLPMMAEGRNIEEHSTPRCYLLKGAESYLAPCRLADSRHGWRTEFRQTTGTQIHTSEDGSPCVFQDTSRCLPELHGSCNLSVPWTVLSIPTLLLHAGLQGCLSPGR